MDPLAQGFQSRGHSDLAALAMVRPHPSSAASHRSELTVKFLMTPLRLNITAEKEHITTDRVAVKLRLR